MMAEIAGKIANADAASLLSPCVWIALWQQLKTSKETVVAEMHRAIFLRRQQEVVRGEQVRAVKAARRLEVATRCCRVRCLLVEGDGHLCLAAGECAGGIDCAEVCAECCRDRFPALSDLPSCLFSSRTPFQEPLFRTAVLREQAAELDGFLRTARDGRAKPEDRPRMIAERDKRNRARRPCLSDFLRCQHIARRIFFGRACRRHEAAPAIALTSCQAACDAQSLFPVLARHRLVQGSEIFFGIPTSCCCGELLFFPVEEDPRVRLLDRAHVIDAARDRRRRKLQRQRAVKFCETRRVFCELHGDRHVFLWRMRTELSMADILEQAAAKARIVPMADTRHNRHAHRKRITCRAAARIWIRIERDVDILIPPCARQSRAVRP